MRGSKLIAGVRAVVGALAMVIATAVLAVPTLAIAAANPASRRIDQLTRLWARLFLRLADTHLSIVDDNGVDTRTCYVVIANHLSDLDIPVCLAASPVGVRFLAKKELFRIPVLGMLLRALGMVRVDRQAGAAGFGKINRAIDTALSRSHSLLVFPEGTRSRTAMLADFKRGAFRIAIDHQIDILPISIHGTSEAWPVTTPWVYGGEVTAVIHTPIAIAGRGRDALDEILGEAHATIAAELERRSRGATEPSATEPSATEPSATEEQGRPVA